MPGNTMHVTVQISEELNVCVCGGVAWVFSPWSGAVKAVRALNRQRIMEIKPERLANGNIMATDWLAQLGHAKEATIAGGGGRIDMYG